MPPKSNAALIAPPAADPWARLKALALDGLSSAHSRRAYSQALEEFQEWCGTQFAAAFDKATVQRYRSALEARAAWLPPRSTSN